MRRHNRCRVSAKLCDGSYRVASYDRGREDVGVRKFVTREEAERAAKIGRGWGDGPMHVIYIEEDEDVRYIGSDSEEERRRGVAKPVRVRRSRRARGFRRRRPRR